MIEQLCRSLITLRIENNNKKKKKIHPECSYPTAVKYEEENMWQEFALVPACSLCLPGSKAHHTGYCAELDPPAKSRLVGICSENTINK